MLKADRMNWGMNFGYGDVRRGHVEPGGGEGFDVTRKKKYTHGEKSRRP